MRWHRNRSRFDDSVRQIYCRREDVIERSPWQSHWNAWPDWIRVTLFIAAHTTTWDELVAKISLKHTKPQMQLSSKTSKHRGWSECLDMEWSRASRDLRQNLGQVPAPPNRSCGCRSMGRRSVDTRRSRTEASTTVTLYGQEKDSATSALARMNTILHNNYCIEQ